MAKTTLSLLSLPILCFVLVQPRRQRLDEQQGETAPVLLEIGPSLSRPLEKYARDPGR
jgi:hypothetical protein